MCKRGGLLVGFDYGAKRALVTDADCDSWACPECSARMSAKWILRAEIGVRQYLGAGQVVDFITLTSHEKLLTWEATVGVWKKAWPVLYAALKRKNVDLQYFLVPEQHKDGRLHVHALWTAGVKNRWLKDNARRRGMGYKTDVSRILTPRSAVQYVTKYVGKSLGGDVPKRFRRVRVSQGWPDVEAPVTELTGLSWEHVGSNGALEAVYREVNEKHMSLIDIRTGAYFDDEDLGTTVAEW